MPAPFLRILAQRRRPATLTAQAPTRSELQEIVRAVRGQSPDPVSWRLIAMPRSAAPRLAAALTGLRALPDIGDGSAPLRGKQLRRLAAFRGSLSFAVNGGMSLALVFSPIPGAESSRRRQRLEAYAIRPLLEAALCATGWGVQWSPRESPDEELLHELYDLSAGEEILGWLFIGRVADPEARAAAVAAPIQQAAPLEFRD